jgi:hypothetical protein
MKYKRTSSLLFPTLNKHLLIFTQTPLKGPSESWGVLWRCFPALRRIGMNPNRINDPSNALSLQANLHKEFGDFKLSFQATVCILANPEFVLSSYYY